MMHLPRLRHEVIVDFFEGDPDRPVVIGRLFNEVNPTAYALPEHATRSVWRSQSSPNGGGFNELMLEDQAGAELVYLRAERDLLVVVEHDQFEDTGANLTVIVGGDRATTIGGNDSTLVGKAFTLANAAIVDAHIPEDLGGPDKRVPPEVQIRPTSIAMEDGLVNVTTGPATTVLQGSNISLHAGQTIRIQAGGQVTIKGKMVHINDGEVAPAVPKQGKGGPVLPAVAEVFKKEDEGSTGSSSP